VQLSNVVERQYCIQRQNLDESYTNDTLRSAFRAVV
jgi:hypothetical protein